MTLIKLSKFLSRCFGRFRIVCIKIAYGEGVVWGKGSVVLGSQFKFGHSIGGRLVFAGNALIRDYVTIRAREADVVLGENVFINSYTSITARVGVVIGTGTMIGEGVRIYDHDHVVEKGRGVSPSEFKLGAVHIGSNVWIGSGAIILRGSVIGDGAVVGAGSLIKGAVPAGAVIYRLRDMV